MRVLFEGRDEAATAKAARAARARVPERTDLQTLGPAPAVIPRLKDRWRVQVLVKAMTQQGFAAAVAAVRDLESQTDQKLRVIVDVDPMSML